MCNRVEPSHLSAEVGLAIAGVEWESLSLLYDYKVRKNISEDYESRRD